MCNQTALNFDFVKAAINIDIHESESFNFFSFFFFRQLHQNLLIHRKENLMNHLT